MSTLSSLYKPTIPATPSAPNGRIPNRTYAFPNSSTTYNTAGNSATPPPYPPAGRVENRSYAFPATPVKKPVFTGGAGAGAGAGSTETTDLYAQYRDANGNILSPEEYANSLLAKARGTNTDIGIYAGGQITDPNQSATDLATQGRNMNNASNDIAVGETDPYKIAGQSGIPYSPAERQAIQNAFAGIYDPVLNDVFTKLDEKKKADDQALADKTWKEQQIFSTNESIRQWRETTGTKSTYGGATFTATQTNKGASNAGMDVTTFESMDPEIKNFYVNTPYETDPISGKSYKTSDTFANLVSQVNAGTITEDEAKLQIDEINVPAAVKTYYINKMKIPEATKQNLLQKVWGWLSGGN